MSSNVQVLNGESKGDVGIGVIREDFGPTKFCRGLLTQHEGAGLV